MLATCLLPACPGEAVKPGGALVFGLVGVGAFGGGVFREVVGGAAVVGPVGVVELDEADTAFDESAGEEAIAGEAGFFGVFDTVEVEGGLGFVTGVHQFGGTGLHAVGHFIGVDAGSDFVVAGFDEVFEVQFANGVDDLALLSGGDLGGGGEVDDRVALVAEGDALVGGGEDAAAPEDGAAARAAGAALEYDKAGKVIALAAKAVSDPSAHAGATEEAAAGVHLEFSRGVVEECGFAGGADAHAVEEGRRDGQALA